MIPLSVASGRLHILDALHLRTERDERKHQREMQKQATMCVGTGM